MKNSDFYLFEKIIKSVGYDGVEIPVFGGEEKISHFAKDWKCN